MQSLMAKARNKARRIVEKTGVLSKINFCRTKYVNGKKIKIPVFGEIGLNNLSISEIWMVDILKHLLKIKTGAFVDVGVNLGQSLIKLKCVNPAVQYIGFEPNPVCIYYVRQLIKKNKFADCTIFPIGLSDNIGLAQLEFLSENEDDSCASLVKNFRPERKISHRQYVPVFTFDIAVSTLGLTHIGLIKIDVEGAELEVIRSLSQTIVSHRPILLLEILPVYSKENKARKDRQEEVEKIMSECGYNIFRVIKTDTDGYNGLQKLTTIGIHSDLNQCDYVLAPEELAQAV
jgi:FkbM family methyltransferase